MARKLNWNPKTQHAELCAADVAIDGLLATAEVTSIKVSGKDVPASEAPLDERIKMYGALAKPGAVTQDMSELTKTMDGLSAENVRQDAEINRLKAANGGLTQRESDLTGRLQTAESAINTITATNAELITRNDAAIRQVGEWTGKYNALNGELSKRCLAEGCISDLRDEKGDLLPSTADASQKQAAADRVKAEDKLNTLCSFKDGKVNRAIAQTGLTANTIPGQPPGVAGPKKELKGRERFLAADQNKQKAA